MQLSARPLVSARDTPLYAARLEVDGPLRRALQSGLNAVIVGPRGSGKTTSVMQAVLACEKEVTIVNAGLARSTLDVINLIADGVGARLPVAARGVQLARLAAPTRSLAGKVAVLHTDEPSTVVVDNLVDADIATELFGSLRDELWATNLSFLTIAEPEATPGLLAPPADAFFDVRVTVGRMDAGLQRDVLRRREALELESVVDPDGSLPRELLERARAATLHSDAASEAMLRVQRLSHSQRRVLDAVGKIGRPVAAGDEELLRVLKLSPARTSQILKQLEDVGLVQSFRSQAGGTGRPPQLFVTAGTPAAA